MTLVNLSLDRSQLMRLVQLLQTVEASLPSLHQETGM